MKLVIVLGGLLFTPVVIGIANDRLCAGRMKRYLRALLSALVVYLFIIASAVYRQYELDNTLASFDLNADGVFSGPELTPQQDKAMLDVIADTGRTLAPFTGAVFSVCYFLLLWLLLTLWSGWRRGNRRHGGA